MKNVKILFLAVLLLFAADFGRYLIYPDIAALKKTAPKESALMRYREREWRRAGLAKKPVRIWAPYSRISPYLKKAVLISEDDKFWKDDGFDLEAMQKAMEKDIKAGRFKFGASTITQQLAKNLFLSPAKNPLRKLKEAILTWRLEKTLSKKRILELYLNYAEWGNGIFGAEAASRHYFGKPASALSAMEAARLAACLPNPIRFSPNSQKAFVERRSRTIYKIMARRGIVNDELDKTIAGIENSEQPSAQESAVQPGLSNTGTGPGLLANMPSAPGNSSFAAPEGARPAP